MKDLHEILKNMKDISEISLITANTAVFSGNKNLAKVSLDLENVFKVTRDEAYRILFGLKGIKKDLLITVTDIIERIGDIVGSASELANIVLKRELHPVLKGVVGEEEKRAFLVSVKQGPILGKSLMELNLEVKMGIKVLAIKRGERWLIDPKSKEKLRDGDLLVCFGKEKSEDMFKKAISGIIRI